MNEEGRYVVGLLVGGLIDNFSIDLHRGVMQRAEEENVNLVGIPGKYIFRELPDELKYEYQYNTLFNMITEENIDAVIIVADSIGNFTVKEKIREFVDRYSEIPSILVASKFQGKSCICYDNYKGINEAIEYLINEKGCTRFAMLGGPIANTDSVERKESLIEVLGRHNIPFLEENYVQTELSGKRLEHARKLLDNNPDVEAIFCVNDEVALGLYQVMEERGLTPGEDIYVLGYDNSRASGQVRPTLSSIWADAQELGRQSFDMALNLIRGRKTPSRNLDTMLVKRDSFGEEKTHFNLADIDTNQIKAIYNKIFYRLQGARGKEYKAYQKVIKDCISIINSTEYAPELHRQLREHFIDALDTGIMNYVDIELLQTVIEEVYKRIAEGEAVRKDRKEVQEGFSDIYRLLIASQEQSIHEQIDSNNSLDYSLKLVAQDMMQFENGNDQNYAIPLRTLPLIGVHNACLYMLENPVVHLEGEEWVAPEYVYMKAILRDDIVNYVTLSEQKVYIDDIFRNEYLTEDRSSMLLLPLFSNETIYGFLYVESSEHMIDNGEMITNQLSAAMKMLYILKANEEIKQQLEENLIAIKENNIILDNLSRVDPLTGIQNRRGFFVSAQDYLEKAYEENVPIIVMYIDMDNLKIVNDRYGHDEGDFSLKLIADTITDEIGEKGTVGRLGGDEFAAVLWADLGGMDIRERIKDKLAAFNEASDKPYNVTASVGVYYIPENTSPGIEEVLSKADEDLYEEKKKRTKKTAKE